MKLILVGFGKMGQALFQGWRKQSPAPDCLIIDPFAENAPDGATLYKNAEDIPADYQADVIVFAVKPQVMGEIVPAYRRFTSDTTLFISIAAGKTLATLESLLSPSSAIIRVMPNTPAAAGKGISVACGNNYVRDGEKQVALDLMAAVGQALWTDDEGLMNAVTAVSGSGPAYIFLLIECLAKAGENSGLPADMAMALARETVIGSAALAADAADTPAATLRENVTSPGGTTAAALGVLMAQDNGLQQLMDKAVAAATARGKELE
ncbi:MAG: pyrroline-5-carboxylate reductase [Pseudomonadota bacterium]|nr:pyrroline-5-carboxylate reductase [Pseudomonadota bacterium]QKK05810.1 MAG: pyrroline-5-carboxylate reductase [Pseudomonadota bacterium]